MYPAVLTVATRATEQIRRSGSSDPKRAAAEKQIQDRVIRSRDQIDQLQGSKTG